ncbi:MULTISPECIES: helix-turn-helix domain-containing protein [unclassified Bradyrhizobium]|uniref:helix-turn-helix domain-containing protein n=1 Tax=unclassified Bradyrhizobium TaxID=2631580 RepID=UPI00041118D9|nr:MULTISPECIES: helix-turn-helix domain-containing protein [unclassified Bradyrhizobium]MCP3461397.1 helix-turn-helix domain-containing protein [Bradyrhizobium sp. CCGUVB23]
MITAAQLRAARALLGIDQRELAQRCSLSLPTIQRMEASEGVIRGNVDSLMKLVEALAAAGIELIGEGAPSTGSGRGVRLKSQPSAGEDNK